MFTHLISQLRLEIETVRRILVINDGIRDLLIVHTDHLSGVGRNLPPNLDDNMKIAYSLSRLIPSAPNKLDWLIYDHCAALTRLYAAYERFVFELVSEYVALLPKLYQKYAELPQCVTTQHRIGIGQILLKLGGKGRYKKLEEQIIVRELAAGLGGAPEYTLLADAFLIDRQNLRFDVLSNLLSTLGFEHSGRFIKKHSAMLAFIKSERADSSSAEKELHDFIDYRNEAAHRRVDNVLSVGAIGAIGRFISALGEALADLVEEEVLRRRISLGHHLPVLKVKEVFYDGFVVVGPLSVTTLKIGDELIVSGKRVCTPTVVQSIQINNIARDEATGDGILEVGVRLDKRAQIGCELHRLQVPQEAPPERQLQLVDVLPQVAAAADTDIADTIEDESSE